MRTPLRIGWRCAAGTPALRGRSCGHCSTNEDFYKLALQEVGGGPGGAARTPAANVPRRLKKGRGRNTCCRRLGAGRIDELLAFKEKVKAWAEEERSYGHTLTILDLLLAFKEAALSDMARLEQNLLEEEGGPEPGDQARALQLKERLQALTSSPTCLKSYTKDLQRHCTLVCRKPQRVIQRSALEEEARWKATWQEWERMLWLACVAPVEHLRGLVADAESLVHNRARTVPGFADQAPFWAKLAPPKTLYRKAEFRKKGEAANPPPAGQQTSHNIAQEDVEGLGQTRGVWALRR